MANTNEMLLVSEEPIIPDFKPNKAEKIVNLRKCCMSLRDINLRNEFGMFGSNKIQFSDYVYIEKEIILTDTKNVK